MESTPGKLNFDVLDGLRGLAAIGVVINHARGWLFAGNAVYLQSIGGWAHASFLDRALVAVLSLTGIGREYVVLFFVLSGFAIAYSVQRSSSVSHFYQRRFIRIYPPYLIGCAWAYLAFLICRSLRPDLFQIDSPSQNLHALYLSANFLEPIVIIRNLMFDPHGAFVGQFWSIAHEVIFYALAPLMLASAKPLARKIYFGFFLICGLVGLTFRPDFAASVPVAFLFLYGPYFALGVWSFDHLPMLQHRLAVPKPLVAVISFIFLLLILSLKLLISPLSPIPMLPAGLIAVFLIANFLHHGITSPSLRFFGKRSYSIYISHLATVVLCLVFYFYFTAHDRDMPILNPWLWMGAVLISLIVSLPVYEIGERWSKRTLEKMRSRRI